MTRKRIDSLGGELSCCDRRALLRSLGAAGLLLLGRCTTTTGRGPAGVDRGLVDGGVPAADSDHPPDTTFVGADGGLPPIDLAAPAVTRMATFALG